jgi:general secretion pathway protein E
VIQQSAAMKIGEALVQIGACARDDVDAALEIAQASGEPLGAVLMRQGKITRNDLLHGVGVQQRQIRANKLAELPEYTVLLTALGGELGIERLDKRYALLGEESGGRKRFFVIQADNEPSPTLGQDSFVRASQLGWRFACRILAPSDVLEVLYAKAAPKQSKIEVGEESGMHRLFHDICRDAFLRNASDIHIVVTGDDATIAYRVHGEVEVQQNLTRERATALCAAAYNTLTEGSSVKSGFNPRALQDAVIQQNYPEGIVRFRYAHRPHAPDGFKVVLRVIPIGVRMHRKSFPDLGYSQDQNELLERMFGTSSGLILFAGTTGSGKSTSLAHALMGMAEENPHKIICTVEEPVEFSIPGAEQTPVVRINDDHTDFINVLRQILRMDPDVIMIGEIRDLATADVTIQAVRSGHLCVSTLHADGAPICYDRLAGMGVPRTDLASVGVVAGLVYQRLVPVLCAHCKIPGDELSRSASCDPRLRAVISRVHKVNNGDLRNIFFRNIKGCKHCVRGHTGRTVAAEILRPTPTMLEAIASKDSNALWRIWRSTISEGHPTIMTGRTAFEHAIYKMRQGIVSPTAVESEFRFLDEQPWKGIERATVA